MLLVVTGSSGAGKSTMIRGLPPLEGLAAHDFDEVGVPAGADTAWRQRTLGTWVARAVALQDAGVDLLLAGQSPLGEVLAVPSATALDGIAVCLVDVPDAERHRRVAARDGGRWNATAMAAFDGWAGWHRGHAADPRYRPDIITRGGWDAMVWHRWTGWRAGDPRWVVDVVDGTGPVEACVERLRRWVSVQRALRGRLPLGPGWAGGTAAPR